MKLSVCMATYNHEKYISQAIESVMIQKTNFKYELVIGEDFSEDRTREICISYKDKYPDNIKLSLNKKNLGVLFNLEQTFHQCSGDYIALLEGDDYWIDSYKLQKQVGFLEKHKDFVMCAHAVKTVFEDNIEEVNRFVSPLEISTFEDIVNHGHFIPTLSIVFRNRIIKSFPNWFYNVWSGDKALILLLSHYGKIYYMREIMGLKRVHKGGITKTPKYLNKRLLTKNSLYLYKNINKHFNYEHKKVLNKKISQLYLRLAIIEMEKGKILDSLANFTNGFLYSPNVIKNKIIKKVFRQ